MAVPARAAELTVLSAGAMVGVAKALAPAFQTETGDSVAFRTDTVGGLVRRISGGEPFDVVLMSPTGLDALAKDGKIDPDSRRILAHVGVGVAVKAGAPKPDISTTEAFRSAVLAARSVAYVDPASGGTSGIYLAGLFRKLGIADAVERKSVLSKGGLAAEALLDGRADLAIGQISELMAVPGVALVGPLPPEIQTLTTYAGAVASDASHADAARGFLGVLVGPAAGPVLSSHGMMTP